MEAVYPSPRGIHGYNSTGQNSKANNPPFKINLHSQSRNMSLIKRLDSWITWGIVGVIIGLSLGVNTASVWLVAIGLGGFLVYLSVHGPAKWETEGSLFAAGGVFMMGWTLGFVVRGLVF